MIILKNITYFDLSGIFLSGQCFRWKPQEDGSFLGVVKNRTLRVEKQGADLVIQGITQQEFEEFYETYFDLQRDYGAIQKALWEDLPMRKAFSYQGELRVLQQEFWEILISFILSQNNNIKRITRIIDELCAQFGPPLGDGMYGFPSPETLSALTVEELSGIGAGFRGKYILDAAQKVAGGEIQEEAIQEMDLETAIVYLTQIKGVGRKVAECVLLYGAKKMDAFPKDVWMIRVVEELYPKGVPQLVKDHAGIAQLYLFYYGRQSGLFEKAKEKEKQTKGVKEKKSQGQKQKKVKVAKVGGK